MIAEPIVRGRHRRLGSTPIICDPTTETACRVLQRLPRSLLHAHRSLSRSHEVASSTWRAAVLAVMSQAVE